MYGSGILVLNTLFASLFGEYQRICSTLGERHTGMFALLKDNLIYVLCVACQRILKGTHIHIFFELVYVCGDTEGEIERPTGQLC